jgi:hypothetical protein
MLLFGHRPSRHLLYRSCALQQPHLVDLDHYSCRPWLWIALYASLEPLLLLLCWTCKLLPTTIDGLSV